MPAIGRFLVFVYFVENAGINKHHCSVPSKELCLSQFQMGTSPATPGKFFERENPGHPGNFFV